MCESVLLSRHPNDGIIYLFHIISNNSRRIRNDIVLFKKTGSQGKLEANSSSQNGLGLGQGFGEKLFAESLPVFN